MDVTQHTEAPEIEATQTICFLATPDQKRWLIEQSIKQQGIGISAVLRQMLAEGMVKDNGRQ
jgi:hypothetical protein